MASVIESVSWVMRGESEAVLWILKLLCSGGLGLLGDEGTGIIYDSPGSGGHFEASPFPHNHTM